MITRIAAKEVKELSENFKAIAIVGPIQAWCARYWELLMSIKFLFILKRETCLRILP